MFDCTENLIERLMIVGENLSHRYLENKTNGNTRQVLILGKTKLHKEKNVVNNVV
jgi:hypothetical protein